MPDEYLDGLSNRKPSETEKRYKNDLEVIGRAVGKTPEQVEAERAERRKVIEDWNSEKNELLGRISHFIIDIDYWFPAAEVEGVEKVGEALSQVIDQFNRMKGAVTGKK